METNEIENEGNCTERLGDELVEYVFSTECTNPDHQHPRRE